MSCNIDGYENETGFTCMCASLLYRDSITIYITIVTSLDIIIIGVGIHLDILSLAYGDDTVFKHKFACTVE